MPLKYSAVLCTLHGFGEFRDPAANVWENPNELLETVAEAGYDGVDLDAEPDRISAERFHEVYKIATSLGLKVPALLAAWGRGHAGEDRDLASEDDTLRNYSISYAKKCVDLSASCGSPCFEICAVPAAGEEYMQPTGSLAVARKTFRKSVDELATYAESKKVPMIIEAINRFEGYQGFMNSIADAMDLVDDINSPYLGVLGDCFHINIEDTSITDALVRAGKKLFHVHLADSNRLAPGTGHIDFLQVIRTLRAIDYDGYLAVDCVPHLPDWKTSLFHSIKYMKELEKAADLLG